MFPVGRALPAVAVMLGLLLRSLPVPAQAPERDADACVATYDDALEKKKRGALRDAHKGFAECTNPSCPGPVREECAEQVQRLAGRIPTVVPAARSRQGDELEDVRVLVDGELLSERIDGRAHRLDPGPHTFRFEPKGAPPKELKVVLAEGERLRRVEVVLGGGSAAADKPIPIPVYVLGGVGVVGLIGFGFFGLSGLAQESDLEEAKCEPNCDQDKTDDLKQTYLFADISLAIGVAALGGATFLYFKSQEDPTEGALVGVQGRF